MTTERPIPGLRPHRANGQRNRVRLAMLGFCLQPFATLSAHPHAWIDVQSAVVVSDNGMATAIEQQWLFDDLYTAYVLDDKQATPKSPMTAAARFAGQAIENLRPHGYFMRILSDGRPVSLGTITQYRSQMQGDRLSFQFTAPLAQPIDLLRHRLEFSVYDPTYFIEMAHTPQHPPQIKGPFATHCHIDLRKATPSTAAMARAFAMDRGAAADQTLGAQFAEKAAVTCQ